MIRPSLTPEYNLHRARQEREKAARCDDATMRDAHLELASLFETRAVEALEPAVIH